MLIALRLDGRTLGAAHLRLVVPADRHGGRNLHDLTTLILR